MTINAIISWPQSSFRQFSHTKENCAIAGELYLQFDQNKILYKTHLTKNEAVELGIENNSELYHALSSAIQHNGLSELKNQYKRALFEITSKAGHTP